MSEQVTAELLSRIKQAIYATTVSRAIVMPEWPECHRKNCQHRHPTPDSAFASMLARVSETVEMELLYRTVTDPDVGDDDSSATRGYGNGYTGVGGQR